MRRFLPFVASCLCSGVIMVAPLPALAAAIKGKPAPAISLPAVSGAKVDLAALRGKVILADFFATWCGPCRDAIPHLNDLQRRLGSKGLQVIGLSVDDPDDLRLVKEFVVAKQINYPVAITTEALRDDYSLRSVPVLYVIDKKGTLVEVFRGLNSDVKKRLDELLQKLLAN